MLFCFLKNASNPNWNKQPGIIECLSSRLRISLPKKIPSVNVRAEVRPKRNPAENFGRDHKPKAVGEAEMASESIILKLTPEDALRLTRILLDDDKEEALLFLKECLKPQLDQTTRGRMVRSFETP
jgi:hypothetical protein